MNLANLFPILYLFYTILSSISNIWSVKNVSHYNNCIFYVWIISSWFRMVIKIHYIYFFHELWFGRNTLYYGSYILNEFPFIFQLFVTKQECFFGLWVADMFFLVVQFQASEWCHRKQYMNGIVQINFRWFHAWRLWPIFWICTKRSKNYKQKVILFFIPPHTQHRLMFINVATYSNQWGKNSAVN